MDRGVVIVGAGQAGFQTALSLRNEGYAGNIALVDDEGRVPYARPPLSKAYLKGTATAESLEYRPAEFFVQQSLDLVLNDPAVEIDRGRQTVALRSGRELEWSSLVLATGAHVRRLPSLGKEPSYLRTFADSESLRSHLSGSGSLLAIGCGFIGLEAAAAARAQGKQVRVIGAEARLMGRAVSPFISAWFHALHERHGVEIQLNTAVQGVSETSAVLPDGTVETADTVVVGIGVIPNTELAAKANLAVSGGIVTDSYLRTNDPAIFAVGDCAMHPNVYAGGLTRIESVQNAADHARAVASTISGRPKEYRQVPWFWTEQFEAKLQIAGLAVEADETEVKGDPESGKFSVYSYKAGKLKFVESVNQPAAHIAARKLIEGVASE